MNIPRTVSRLSNERLFHDADGIVFTEGGVPGNPTIEPVLDVAFWKMIFSLFSPGKRLHFKPQGGKPNLAPLAQQVSDNELDSVVVCMDRDYDHLGDKVDAPSVFYTHGYSWENDVWSPGVLEELFYVFHAVDQREIDVRPAIEHALADVQDKMKCLVCSDMLAVAAGVSILPRDGFQHVKIRQDAPPVIDYEFLTRRARACRDAIQQGRQRRPKLQPITLADIHGHLLSHFCFHFLQYLLQTHGGEPIRKRQVFGTAIRLARDQFQTSRPEVFDHYLDQFRDWEGQKEQ